MMENLHDYIGHNVLHLFRTDSFYIKVKFIWIKWSSCLLLGATHIQNEKTKTASLYTAEEPSLHPWCQFKNDH